MAKVFRLDITKQNCFKCDHFRRDEQPDPNEGSCTATAPRGRGAVAGGISGNPQSLINCHIFEPEETYCGKFKLWTGPAREILPVIE